MYVRENALKEWLAIILKDTVFTLMPLAGDASFRRYFRLKHGNRTYVVMDAPPEQEKIQPFIAIGKVLAHQGIHTPAVHAVETTQGFILLEDLGDHLLLSTLTTDNADALYKAAMTTLIELQQSPVNDLPHFDKPHMLQELSLFRQWFLHEYLALKLNATDEQCIDTTFNWLADEIANQPQVFVHRDYHSRNLIVVDESTPIDIGVIDFQDAMQGPWTYDLVSLLKDCYIQWPREQISNWLHYFYLQRSNTAEGTLAQFTYGFDLCGLQRHLKVLGIFCRLHIRDHKPNYLRDLPLIFNYVLACLESYPQLQPFYHFMQQKVQAPFLAKTKE